MSTPEMQKRIGFFESKDKGRPDNLEKKPNKWSLRRKKKRSLNLLRMRDIDKLPSPSSDLDHEDLPPPEPEIVQIKPPTPVDQVDTKQHETQQDLVEPKVIVEVGLEKPKLTRQTGFIKTKPTNWPQNTKIKQKKFCA